jgi:hypothetical protein
MITRSFKSSRGGSRADAGVSDMDVRHIIALCHTSQPIQGGLLTATQPIDKFLSNLSFWGPEARPTGKPINWGGGRSPPPQLMGSPVGRARLDLTNLILKKTYRWIGWLPGALPGWVGWLSGALPSSAKKTATETPAKKNMPQIIECDMQRMHGSFSNRAFPSRFNLAAKPGFFKAALCCAQAEMV